MSALFAFDGMKRPSFVVKIDMESSTVADIFREVAKSYELELDPRRHLRIVFAGKELKFSKKKKLSDVGIINHSTIAVIFQLPDRLPTLPTATESMSPKKSEKSRDAHDVSILENFSLASMTVKEEEENKDADDISVAESQPLTTDEESKDAADVSVAESKPLTTDEESKDAENVSVVESKPLTTDEESKDAEYFCVAQSKPLTTDEESKNAVDVSVVESKPLTTDEESKDAEYVSVAQSKPLTTDEESKNAVDVSVAQSKPLTTDEESKDAEDVSVAESKPLTTDEESKDAEYFCVVESKPLTTDEESKDAEYVSVSESKPLTTDDKTKDEEYVSAADSVSVKTDGESKEANVVSFTKYVPVKAKSKNKKKKGKDAKAVSVLENAVEAVPATSVKEDKEADAAPAAESSSVKAKKKRKKNKRKTAKAMPVLDQNVIESKNSANVTLLSKTIDNNSGEIPGTTGKVEKKVKRPMLQRLPGVIELTFLPDFMDFNFDWTQIRAILPCFHVMGSETMRSYCENLIDVGNVEFKCPYLLPFPPVFCPTVWDYTLVRHVACFTGKERHNTEKNIAINFIGKDLSTLTCPGCFTWCSKADRKLPRLGCFVCTKAMGREFIFCGDCLGDWKNVSSGSCANSKCTSIDAMLDILRNSRTTNLYGGTWPVMRLCPRCGILTEFMGGCSQVHCRSCGYYYCFLCLKGAKSKAELQCNPYNSDCQMAPLQTSFPQWDGHGSG